MKTIVRSFVVVSSFAALAACNVEPGQPFGEAAPAATPDMPAASLLRLTVLQAGEAGPSAFASYLESPVRMFRVSRQHLSPDGDITTTFASSNGIDVKYTLSNALPHDDLEHEVTIDLSTFTGSAPLPTNHSGPVLTRTVVASDLPSLASQQTEYFCQGEKGIGGVLAAGQVRVSVDGQAPQLTTVDIVRTGEGRTEQHAAGTCSSASQGMDWCISWWSSQCHKVERADGSEIDCNAGRSCRVSFTRLLSIAVDEFRLPVPLNIIVEESLEKLSAYMERNGYGVGGKCGEIYLAKLIYIGCQCVLARL